MLINLLLYAKVRKREGRQSITANHGISEIEINLAVIVHRRLADMVMTALIAAKPDVKISTAKVAKSAKENLKHPFALFVCLAAST